MHLTGLLPCRAVRREFRGGLPRPLVGSDREGQVDPRLFTSSVLVISSNAPGSSIVSCCRSGTLLGILQSDSLCPLQVLRRLWPKVVPYLWLCGVWKGGGRKRHMPRND